MVYNDDALNERANDLEAQNFNGLERVIVRVHSAAVPPFAELELYFHNTHHRNTLITAGNTPTRAARLFPIRGGLRVRAGAAAGQVQVFAAGAGPTADSVLLQVRPLGDYSTYTLTLDADSIDPALALPAVSIDPIFSELPFKFRPGCFTNNCAPEWDHAPAPKASPAIDYLAKDFDSFRHTMMAAMTQRVPGWQSTSEADLDQVIISLTSAIADELSDFQDRTVNEAYLTTCRSRVSLARHARLMDYHIHQGNQARTWMALELDRAVVAGIVTLPARHRFWTGEQATPGFARRLPDATVFATHVDHLLHPILGTLSLYTWDDAIPALAAGSTTADLSVDVTGLGLTEQQGAQLVTDFINEPDPTQFQVRQLLIQEWLNPETGTPNGRDPLMRQLLRLREGGDGALVIEDTLRSRFLVRVRWIEDDQLRSEYPFVVFPRWPSGAGCHPFPRESRACGPRCFPHRHLPRARGNPRAGRPGQSEPTGRAAS
jgi:hypothetical protein